MCSMKCSVVSSYAGAVHTGCAFHTSEFFSYCECQYCRVKKHCGNACFGTRVANSSIPPTNQISHGGIGYQFSVSNQKACHK